MFNKYSTKQTQIQALAEAAKNGDYLAKEELLKIHATVWTNDQIDALNDFLTNREEYLQTDKLFCDQTVYVNRSPTHTMELADILWLSQKINPPPKNKLYLACLEYDDGCLSYWMVRLNRGVVYPIVDVTHWKDKNHIKRRKKYESGRGSEKNSR